MSDSPLSAVLSAIDQVVIRLDRVDSRLEGVDSRLDRVDSRLDRVDSRLDRVDSRLDRIEAGQAQLRADLMERIDRLQDGFNDLREGQVVDWGHVERAERIARGASDEVRALAEQVTALTRYMHRLEASIAQLRGEG